MQPTQGDHSGLVAVWRRARLGTAKSQNDLISFGGLVLMCSIPSAGQFAQFGTRGNLGQSIHGRICFFLKNNNWAEYLRGTLVGRRLCGVYRMYYGIVSFWLVLGSTTSHTSTIACHGPVCGGPSVSGAVHERSWSRH